VQTGIEILETANKTPHIAKNRIAKPVVFIPVFPGTNCEYDSRRAFEKAGAVCETMIFRNLSSNDIHESVGRMAELINKSNIVMIPGGFSAGDEPEGSGKFIATVFRNPDIAEAMTKLIETGDGLVLGICNGFQALIKLGLLPYGKIGPMEDDSPTLTFNTIGRHVSTMVRTRISSDKSPWMQLVNIGDIHTVPVSHGEGRFFADSRHLMSLFKNGQVATQYVDDNGNPTYDIRFNPNGSVGAIEGITSPDGRIFGKMAHSERIGEGLLVNVPGDKDQRIFESGVKYFK
jgi:phosphoribosylformylglycinamidine synthase